MTPPPAPSGGGSEMNPTTAATPKITSHSVFEFLPALLYAEFEYREASMSAQTAATSTAIEINSTIRCCREPNMNPPAPRCWVLRRLGYLRQCRRQHGEAFRAGCSRQPSIPRCEQRLHFRE